MRCRSRCHPEAAEAREAAEDAEGPPAYWRHFRKPSHVRRGSFDRPSAAQDDRRFEPRFGATPRWVSFEFVNGLDSATIQRTVSILVASAEARECLWIRGEWCSTMASRSFALALRSR